MAWDEAGEAARDAAAGRGLGQRLGDALRPRRPPLSPRTRAAGASLARLRPDHPRRSPLRLERGRGQPGDRPPPDRRRTAPRRRPRRSPACPRSGASRRPGGGRPRPRARPNQAATSWRRSAPRSGPCCGTTSFEETVVAAVSLGDDADTTGAVAGALAGAHYGQRGHPRALADPTPAASGDRGSGQAPLRVLRGESAVGRRCASPHSPPSRDPGRVPRCRAGTRT